MSETTLGAPAIEVEGLGKSFGDVVAVDDLSFTVGAGKVTGFLGPNGAGKSTTLRMLLGLIRPDAGRARIAGRAYADLGDPAGTIGALLDADQFHPQRSGRNHLRVVATAAGIPMPRVDQVLEQVDLTHAAARKAGGYSLGMKQRLGLASALLGDPDVLVLDEPANGLDPAGMLWLRSVLRGFAAAGRAVFVSSHQLGQMADIADDVIVIDRGRLVIQAPVADVVDLVPSRGVRVVTPEPELLAELLRRRSIEVERLSPDALRVAAAADVVGYAALELGVPIFGLTEEERSLEDAFLDLTNAGEGTR